MSLLAQVNQPNGNLSASGAPQYYFPLDSSPANAEVTAPAFIATGVGEPNNDGRFIARGDASGNDVTGAALGFQLRKGGAFALQQWAIGMVNAPAGANSGNDLAIVAYDDASVFLGTPLQIDRSSGLVTIGTDLSVVESVDAASVMAGTPTTVGGGDIQVNGTLGVAQVYDSIYNRPNAGIEVLNNSYGPTGTLLSSIVYTPPNSGLYTITMEVSVDTAGLAWTNGVALIVGYMGSPFPPFSINTDSYLACDSVANPAAFPFPTTGGTITTGIYKKDVVAIVALDSSIQYAAQATFSAGINLGATGGIRFFIQPLLA
jgi:hypothetical protein